MKNVDQKNLKVVFAPGCFDQFDGTQEELDKFVEDIQRMVDSGELFEQSNELTEDDFDELPDEVKEQLFLALNADSTKRNLQ